jgi:MSHA biogenesis protein MshK
MKTSRKSKVESRKGTARGAGSSLGRPALRAGTNQTLPHPSSLALCLALACSTALAQIATDPTRPPSEYATGTAETAADGGGLTLQSVLISPSYKAAIISGVMVKEGEKLGDAVLVKVAENEVVLRTAGASQVLKLHPGVEKREVAPADKVGGRKGKAGASSR